MVAYQWTPARWLQQVSLLVDITMGAVPLLRCFSWRQTAHLKTSPVHSHCILKGLRYSVRFYTRFNGLKQTYSTGLGTTNYKPAGQRFANWFSCISCKRGCSPFHTKGILVIDCILPRPIPQYHQPCFFCAKPPTGIDWGDRLVLESIGLLKLQRREEQRRLFRLPSQSRSRMMVRG